MCYALLATPSIGKGLLDKLCAAHPNAHDADLETSLCRSERLAKYNQLLRIEEELGSDATYAGDNWRHISW